MAIELLPFVLDDGGRRAAGYGRPQRDCVARAVAIVSGLPYAVVWNDLAEMNASQGKRRSADHGVYAHRPAFLQYMRDLGFEYVDLEVPACGDWRRYKPTYLRAGFQPGGPAVVAIKGHLVAVVDGVIRDWHNCQRKGRRAIRGYWIKC